MKQDKEIRMKTNTCEKIGTNETSGGIKEWEFGKSRLSPGDTTIASNSINNVAVR